MTQPKPFSRATRTKHGDELALKLIPSLDDTKNTSHLARTCALICRHAATIGRLAEAACNRELSAEEVERDRACETRIRELVTELPLVGGKPIGVEFQGDPRGATVKLIMSDGRGDSMGGGGRMTVPGS